MDTAQTPDSLLDARAVAKWLGIAPATVYEQAARGALPHLRLWRGARRTLIRFSRQAIERFLLERAVPGIHRPTAQ